MQNNKSTFIAAGVLLVLAILGVGAYALSNSQTANSNTSTTTSSVSTATTATATSQTTSVSSTQSGISMTEVAKHNSSSDCWLVVSGKVYNVTSYVSRHPGGNEILKGCGKDATSMFANVGHSSTARNMLNSFYVGDVAK
jgi:cytochrome b involved in lipid metabolism